MIDSTCFPTCNGLILLVLDWIHLFMVDSTCTWSLRLAYHTFHLVLCDVTCIQRLMYSIFLARIWLILQLWCDPTCNWLILLAFDWFYLFMVDSTCPWSNLASISCIRPVVVWCDLNQEIANVFHLFGSDMIYSTYCGVIWPVIDWFYLYLTGPTISRLILPGHDFCG